MAWSLAGARQSPAAMPPGRRPVQGVFFVLVATLALLGSLPARGTGAAAASNAIVNGSYEAVTNGVPDGWDVHTFTGTPEVAVDGTVAHDGSRSVRLRATSPARARVGRFAPVAAQQYYELSQWIKTDGIVSDDLGTAMRVQFQAGSDAPIADTTRTYGAIKGTNGWTQVRRILRAPAGATQAYVESFLWNATGTVWFDQAELRPTSTLPAPYEVRAAAHYSSDDHNVRVTWRMSGGTEDHSVSVYASPVPITAANLAAATLVREGVPGRDGRSDVVLDLQATPHIGLVARDGQGRSSGVAGVRVESRMLPTLQRDQHPRILASAADFARIKTLLRSDPVLQRWHAELEADARSIMAQPPVRHELDGKRLLEVSREVLIRVQTLGVLYQLDGDQAYADRAWQELDAAARFPDWNPNHFLDTAEMTAAFAIGYDWFHGPWDETRLATLRTAIIDKGLNPALRAYRGDTSGVPDSWFWVDTKINWNVVVNSGISLGALAIADAEPDLAEETLQHARTSIQNGLRGYAGDGSYGEGLNYWNYATSYLVNYLATLQEALNTDYGMSWRAGIDRTGSFPIHLTGPEGTFNYGDTWPGKISAPHLFWLASRFEQPSYAAYQRPLAAPHPLDLLWYVPDSGDSLPDMPLDSFFNQVQNATMRSAWDDPRALYAAFKGGDNQAGHNDLDLGSFVLDANGVRWAEELGADDYDLPGYFDYGSRGSAGPTTASGPRAPTRWWSTRGQTRTRRRPPRHPSPGSRRTRGRRWPWPT